MLDGLSKVLFFQQLSARLKELGLQDEDYQLVMSNAFPMVRFNSSDIDLNDIAVQLSKDFFPTVVDDFVDPNNPENFELVLGFAPGFKHQYQFYHNAPHFDVIINSSEFMGALINWVKATTFHPDLGDAFETFYNTEEEGVKVNQWTNPSDLLGFEKFICFWLICSEKGFPIPEVKTKFDSSVTIKQLVGIYQDLINKVSPRLKSITDE